MTEKKKICKNCQYFHKHYTGNSAVSFVFANNVCTYQMPVYVKEKHYCGYWKAREEDETCNNNPEVKAIPVEWLMKRADSDNIVQNALVRYLIELWEGEQNEH